MIFSRVKSKIKKIAFSNKIWIEKIRSHEDLLIFISRFRQHYVSCDLIRIGGEGDGGYLHPKILENIKYCFSPGISSKIDFERELSESYNIVSFMADASITNPPINNCNFYFIPKFLASYSDKEFITLSDWVNSSINDDEGAKILQMDIEGSEYDVLTFEDSDTLAGFSTLIIEFHGLNNMFKKSFLRMVSAIFEKIYKNFSICHVHPNNCCPVATIDGIGVPEVIEVTFIRNDLLPKYSNNSRVYLPHRLDRKNVERNTDILMPRIWWDTRI